MILQLSNGRQFIIKLSYLKKYKTSFKKDEYGREIYMSWVERDTVCKVEEYFKKPRTYKISYTGLAHCHYTDKFDKIIGRNLAYFKALDAMVDSAAITTEEYDEMISFELNCQKFISKKPTKVLSAKVSNTTEVTNE